VFSGKKQVLLSTLVEISPPEAKNLNALRAGSILGTLKRADSFNFGPDVASARQQRACGSFGFGGDHVAGQHTGDFGGALVRVELGDIGPGFALSDGL